VDEQPRGCGVSVVPPALAAPCCIQPIPSHL